MVQSLNNDLHLLDIAKKMSILKRNYMVFNGYGYLFLTREEWEQWIPCEYLYKIPDYHITRGK